MFTIYLHATLHRCYADSKHVHVIFEGKIFLTIVMLFELRLFGVFN